jgi:hypothetical protein
MREAMSYEVRVGKMSWGTFRTLAKAAQHAAKATAEEVGYYGTIYWRIVNKRTGKVVQDEVTAK